jgi:TPP-dependent indolepyruvate ferredoxin oxidoreductase alpha subunit
MRPDQTTLEHQTLIAASNSMLQAKPSIYGDMAKKGFEISQASTVPPAFQRSIRNIDQPRRIVIELWRPKKGLEFDYL